MSWIDGCKRKAMSLPKEKRQEFIDYMWENMTLGEARKKAGISDEEATGLMLLNIVENKFKTFNITSV